MFEINLEDTCADRIYKAANHEEGDDLFLVSRKSSAARISIVLKDSAMGEKDSGYALWKDEVPCCTLNTTRESLNDLMASASSGQTPSLPDAHPRPGHFRCGGRKSNLLAENGAKSDLISFFINQYENQYHLAHLDLLHSPS
jgi:hypothetical protein